MDSHRSNSATLNSRSVLWDRTRPGYVTSFPSSRSRYGSSGTQPLGLEAPLSPSTPAVRATWVVEMESYLQASAEKCSQEFQETVATLSDMVKEHRDTNKAHCFSSPALSRRLNQIPTAPLNSTQDHTTLMSTIHFLLNELRGAQLQIETLQKVNQQLVHQRSNGWQEQEQEQEQQAGNFGDEREVISSSLLPRPEHSELRLRLARAEEVLDCSNSVIHTQTLHIHQGTMECNRLRWRVYAYRLLLYDTAASNSRPEHKINSYQFQVEPSASHTEAHQISSVPHTSCYSAISHPTPQSLTVCHLDEADVPKVFDLFEYALIGALPSGRQLFEILRALGLFASLPRAQSIQRQLTCLGIPLTECVDNVSCSRSVHSGYRHHFIDRICFESILRYALGTSKTIVPPDTRMETAFLAHPNQSLPGCPETRETTEMNTTRTLPQELGLRDSMYPLKRRFVLQEDEAHFAFRLLCPHNTCSPEPPAIRGEQIPVILRILGIGEPTLHHSAQSESANPDALPRRFHFPGKKLNLSEFCALIRIAQTNPVAV